MFLPFFKIVKKTHTRWSQATKERKMEQKPKTTNPRERNDKEDNSQNRDENINRNFREEMHQKKLSSHRNIKKSTRRRDIIISFSVYLYRIDSYNC